MNLISKIRHIFPYLYYRSYQFYDKHEGHSAEFSASMWVIAIKSMYVVMYVLFPLDIILCKGFFSHLLENATATYSRGVLLLLLAPLYFPILIFWERKQVKKYHEMIHLWDNESLSQRRKKWWILFFVCAFAFLSVIPVVATLRYFFPPSPKVSQEMLIIDEVNTNSNSHIQFYKEENVQETQVVEEENTKPNSHVQFYKEKTVEETLEDYSEIVEELQQQNNTNSSQ